jgi:predicted amidophosphoribosyltransferase
MNADYFESEKKWQRQFKMQEETMQELRKKLEKCEEELKREKENSADTKNSKGKIEEENQKLK